MVATVSRSLPPGSYGWPVVGETLGWLRDPETWARDHLERYGSVFKTRVLGRKVIVMIGPEANRFILWSHRDHFEWAGGYRAFTSGLFPGSLSMEDGDVHEGHRKQLQPTFRGRALEGHFPVIHRQIVDHVREWARAGEIVVFDRLRRLTFNVIARVLLDVTDEHQIEVLTRDFEELSRGVLSLVKWRIPGTRYSRAHKARNRLEESLHTALQRARNNSDDKFLGGLARSGAFTDDVLVSQVLGLLFDAQDTTSTTLTWLLYELDRHPDVLRRLRDEVRESNNSQELDPTLFGSMKYLDAVIQEAGRLHHPAPAMPRKVIKAFEFNGYHVPEGSLVLYSPAISHRLPEVFDDPDEFDPSRFLPPREEHKREPFGLVTFGGGPRTCLGSAFATLEMKTLIAMLTRDYEWSVLPGQDLRPRYFPTKRPRSGLRLRFARLKG